MKQVILISALAGLSQAAAAHPVEAPEVACHSQTLAGGEVCVEARRGVRPFVATSIDSVVPSEADITLRNPLAPQSNYTAKFIEDDAVFAAQVVLRKNGCYDGRLDGVLADGTVYAIKLFEANIGLIPTGALGEETASALRASHDRFDICR